MPMDKSKYPRNWAQLRAQVLERAGGCCEGSPRYPDCRADNGQPHPVTGSKVVLTIAHIDHNPQHNQLENLRAWCQRCHNNYDMWYRHAKGDAKQRAYPYYYRVKTDYPQYFGYPCRVQVWGKAPADGHGGNCLLQFPDGQQVIANRRFIRKRKRQAANDGQ